MLHSHRIASHRIASHRVVSYRIASRAVQHGSILFDTMRHAASIFLDPTTISWHSKDKERGHEQYELTLVTLILGNLLRDMLNLQQQLHALDGRDGSLGDRRGHTAGYEILGERYGIRESRHRG